MTLEKIEKLSEEFEKFKSNLISTEHQETKDAVAFLEKYAPNKAFQYWALMKIDRDVNLVHTQNLSMQILNQQDHISELLGRGAEVIKERDELLQAMEVYAPDWESKLLWCVEIAEEPDSPFDQFPASSKSIAKRAVKRYHDINNNSYKDVIAKSANSCIQVAMWNGLHEDHVVDLFNESWFELPLFQCDSAQRIEAAFKSKDLVECTHNGQVLVTKDIDEAKRFFEMA